jgi:hypothetical protein
MTFPFVVLDDDDNVRAEAPPSASGDHALLGRPGV